MTKEAILKSVNEIINSGDYYKLDALKSELIEDIRVEVEKSKGTKQKDVSIIKTIINQCKQNPIYGKYHEFDYRGKSYKGFLEGHYILASNNDFGYKSADDKALKIGNILIDFDNNKDIKIEVDIVDLKTFIKTREDKTKPYILKKDDFVIGFNPKFLLDCLEFCETNVIYCTAPKCPAFMKNNNDMDKLGLLLPISLPKSE